MKRTIQIGDKYKEVINDYEAQYDKEEFNMLITKLLVLNRELKNKNIDIFTIGDLIKNYNIDFFSLVQSLSMCAKPISNTEEESNHINSPIVTNKKDYKKDKENLKEKEISIESNINTNKEIIKYEEVVEEVKTTNKFDNSLFINDNSNLSENITSEEDKPNFNPILDLGIDLTS